MASVFIEKDLTYILDTNYETSPWAGNVTFSTPELKFLFDILHKPEQYDSDIHSHLILRLLYFEGFMLHSVSNKSFSVVNDQAFGELQWRRGGTKIDPLRKELVKQELDALFNFETNKKSFQYVSSFERALNSLLKLFPNLVDVAEENENGPHGNEAVLKMVISSIVLEVNNVSRLG